jgi:hypothetical protein
MESELPTIRQGAEQSPAEHSQNFERAPIPSVAPEQGIERSAERHEQASEQAARSTDATPVLPAPVVPTTPSTGVADSTTALPVVDDLPIVAGDDDLIEKEWVDKAKKIIATTKDDPYRREQEVGKLQADYLKKRYGKELGAAE